MRNLLGLFLILTVLFSCDNPTKSGNTFTGVVKGVEDGTKAYISEVSRGNQTKIIDSGVVKGEKLVINLPKVNHETLNLLKIEGVEDEMIFINENKSLTSDLQRDNLHTSQVKGGKSNELFVEYRELLDRNNRRLLSLTDNYTADEMNDPMVRQYIMEDQQMIEAENKEYRINTIKENPDALPSLFLLVDLMNARSVTQPEIKSLYDGLSSALKENYIGREIGNQLSASAGVSVGEKAPDFSAPTPEGNMFALKDALDKYTLIDFWAAWCKPCRVENPNLVNVYNKYHDKGFNILGVSLDRKEADWLRAIEQDGLVWPQISNLQFWNDPIAKEYNIRAIPANFLLDANGVIVAANLRGQALEKKIEELLGS